MKIIDQHTKKIMEDCKLRARDAGLRFDDESLEYIVTNQDLIELSPKGMIPTLYDYWVNDVEVLKGKGQYKLYPNNPYETVINSRPAISYYNDNNPDWLNIMIFYHVLGHIDFFQNNVLFEHTWKDDFVGQALADKRHITQLRSEHGRWVDYIIEFSRSIDNLVGYFQELSSSNFPESMIPGNKLSYYFDEFLPKEALVNVGIIYSEIERYNKLHDANEFVAEQMFFSEIKGKYPEFESKYQRYIEKTTEQHFDIMDYIRDNSPFLKKDENAWMKSVMNIVRDTSMYFSPQIRTKTINEGWASYWHDELFRSDSRIKGHESEYAVINSKVTSISRVGYNPYAIGLRLVQYVENLADSGKISREYQLTLNSNLREEFNKNTGNGKKSIFKLRENFSDFMLINTFVNQEFVDLHKLFVVGQRLNQQRGTVEYYVKSRKAEDYKQMLIDNMYNPPFISVDLKKSDEKTLYLKHSFEGRQIYKPYIQDTLLGIEYLWFGNNAVGQVILETTDIVKRKANDDSVSYEYKPILYIMSNKKMSKRYL
jgi:stage V sporulation protein R